MTDWMSTLIAILFAVGVAVFVLLKPILAATTTPSDDLTRIRAELEGPQGIAGPSMKVIDIRRSGVRPGTGQGDLARSYLVTLQHLDGRSERRRVQIETALFGQGAMWLDPPQPGPSSELVQGRTRVNSLRLILGLSAAGLTMAAVYFVPSLPLIGEAKDQLGYVLGRKDIRIVELYSRGQMCGVYTAGADRRPMRFLIDDGKVWTGLVLPGGPRQDAQGDPEDPYNQWSSCVINGKGGRGDESFALWVLNLIS